MRFSAEIGFETQRPIAFDFFVQTIDLCTLGCSFMSAPAAFSHKDLSFEFEGQHVNFTIVDHGNLLVVVGCWLANIFFHECKFLNNTASSLFKNIFSWEFGKFTRFPFYHHYFRFKIAWWTFQKAFLIDWCWKCSSFYTLLQLQFFATLGRIGQVVEVLPLEAAPFHSQAVTQGDTPLFDPTARRGKPRKLDYETRLLLGTDQDVRLPLRRKTLINFGIFTLRKY